MESKNKVNKMYDVDGLCHGLIRRCRAVVEKGGDRLVNHLATLHRHGISIIKSDWGFGGSELMSKKSEAPCF